MGIVRYPVECPGCREKILLRLAVGLDDRQPFFYVCPKCKAATRGALLWHGGAHTSLELSDGHQLSPTAKSDSALSINPEFPALPTTRSMAEPGGSAFLMFSGLLPGKSLPAYLDVTRGIRPVLKEQWPAIERLTTYYLNRDWSHFDRAAKGFLPSKMKRISHEWQRDDLTHRLYDTLFIPILVLDGRMYYPEMKSEFNELWTKSRPHFAAVTAFAKSEADADAFRAVHQDLFQHLARYVQLLGAVLPGLLCNMLPDEHQAKVDAWRLFRDDYELLRDLYIQAFETCHKALRWVLGTVNADAHGDPNTFAITTAVAARGVKKASTSLDSFDQLPSVEKRKWLGLLPVWDRHWDDLFDRHLRNDIGHAAARHDLPSGTIRRDKKHALPYTRFVQRVQRLIHGLIVTVNALKMVRVYSVLT